jgi:hypothetical protein
VTAHNSDVVGEGANVDLLAEACLNGFGFQGLDVVAIVDTFCAGSIWALTALVRVCRANHQA